MNGNGALGRRSPTIGIPPPTATAGRGGGAYRGRAHPVYGERRASRRCPGPASGGVRVMLALLVGGVVLMIGAVLGGRRLDGRKA